MLATRCCSYNASYNICRDRQTFHPAAVLRKFSTSTHSLNCLACAGSNDRPGKQQEAGNLQRTTQTTPLHGYSRRPVLVSVTSHSISHLYAPRRCAPRVPPHYAVHLLSGSRRFKYLGLPAVTQGPGNHSSCARWVAGTGCALPYMDRRWRKRKPCTGSAVDVLHWQVSGSHRVSGRFDAVEGKGRGV